MLIPMVANSRIAGDTPKVGVATCDPNHRVFLLLFDAIA
jgi:hypothetical protein